MIFRFRNVYSGSFRMENGSRRLTWILDRPLCFFLPLQAALLFWQLDLLPVWGDELGTLRNSALPLSDIPKALQDDYHPPLYYLLVHLWRRIPWPMDVVTQVRALSAVAALLSTVALSALWLKKRDRILRTWFLALWTLSPCLVLYGRMARAYSLQILFGLLAVAAAVRFIRNPGGRREPVLYALAAAALLYTHYAPGIAVIAGVGAVFLWKRWRDRAFRRLWNFAWANALIAIFYIPWWSHLAKNAGEGNEEVLRVAGHAGLDHVTRLAYWFVSFSFGETLPLWAVAGGACLAPLMAWLLWRAFRRPPEWLAVVLAVSVIGYVGVSRWVSFAFVPARLIILLPFFLLLLIEGAKRSPRAGTIACAGLLVLSVGSLSSYYRRADFLNKAYLMPNEEIAGTINQRAVSGSDILVMDRANTNVYAVLDRLSVDLDIISARYSDWTVKLRASMRRRPGGAVWIVRNTHDTVPAQFHKKLETELSATHSVRRYLFLRYSDLDRLLMPLMGWTEKPTHVLQLLEFRAR